MTSRTSYILARKAPAAPGGTEYFTGLCDLVFAKPANFLRPHVSVLLDEAKRYEPATALNASLTLDKHGERPEGCGAWCALPLEIHLPEEMTVAPGSRELAGYGTIASAPVVDLSAYAGELMVEGQAGAEASQPSSAPAYAYLVRDAGVTDRWFTTWDEAVAAFSAGGVGVSLLTVEVPTTAEEFTRFALGHRPQRAEGITAETVAEIRARVLGVMPHKAPEAEAPDAETDLLRAAVSSLEYRPYHIRRGRW